MPALTFILGREPHLSVAEIAAVLGDGADWSQAELSAEALVVPISARHFEGETREISHNGTPSNNARSLAVLEMTGKIMARLGGTIKIGEVWTEISNDEFRMTSSETIGKYILQHTNAGQKVHFGYSVYDLGGGRKRADEVRRALVRGATMQKAWLAKHGRKVRWVTSREPTLSSVVVTKNHLLPEDNGVEALVLIAGDRVLLGRTLAVQPFEEWGRRDYGRPKRDSRSGMLPPKLARAMINLAFTVTSIPQAGDAEGGSPTARNQISMVGVRSGRTHEHDVTLLDPFCGSGTILTEAMALGVPRIIGTDVSAEAVRDARANVEWAKRVTSSSGDLQPAPAGASGVATNGGLKASATIRNGITVTQCDVRHLSQCVAERVDAIVTEPYLGPPTQAGKRRVLTEEHPMLSLPRPARRGSLRPALDSALTSELRALYLSAFREFAKVLKPGGRVVFIIPVFRGRPEQAVTIDKDVHPFGFHRINPFPPSFHDHPMLRGKEGLPYARADQRVGRRVLMFELKRVEQPNPRLSKISRS